MYNVSGHLRVVVVEDDPAVRHLIDRALTSRGHNVLVASHAGEAWALLFDFPHAPHLALVDLVLPGTRGLTLADDLRQKYVDMRVVFMTGATLDADILTAQARGPLLEKPFTLQALISLVEAPA